LADPAGDERAAAKRTDPIGAGAGAGGRMLALGLGRAVVVVGAAGVGACEPAALLGVDALVGVAAVAVERRGVAGDDAVALRAQTAPVFRAPPAVPVPVVVMVETADGVLLVDAAVAVLVAATAPLGARGVASAHRHPALGLRRAASGGEHR